MTDRAVSAAVDAALCLLLVSASVLAVTGVGPQPAPAEPTASRAIQLLGATSTTVTARYTAAPTEHTARGSLAGLLADAAALRAGDAPGAAAFADAVRNATRRAISRLPAEVTVRVTWRAGPDEPIASRVVVGRPPPPDAAVRAARLVVAVGSPRPNETVTGQATVVARTWSP